MYHFPGNFINRLKLLIIIVLMVKNVSKMSQNVSLLTQASVKNVPIRFLKPKLLFWAKAGSNALLFSGLKAGAIVSKCFFDVLKIYGNKVS